MAYVHFAMSFFAFPLFAFDGLKMCKICELIKNGLTILF